MFSWYTGDCWLAESLTSAMIRKVNTMHRFVASKVRPLGLDLLGDRVRQVFQESSVDTTAVLSRQDRVFLENVSQVREGTAIAPEFWEYVTDSSLFSQTDMTLVQSAFFGQVLLYPEPYGAAWLSKQQVSDFLHLWRVNGWYLGITDQNNAVLESVEETRALGRLVMERILKPCMLHVTPDSLYMAKAALFPGMDYHVVAYSNYELVGLPLHDLWQAFSLAQVVQYYVRRWYWRHLYPLPGLRHVANWFSTRLLTRLLTTFRKSGKATF